MPVISLLGEECSLSKSAKDYMIAKPKLMSYIRLSIRLSICDLLTFLCLIRLSKIQRTEKL